MKRIFVVCLLAVLLPCCVSAYDFIVDGIYYKVVSEEDRLCKIVSYHEEDDPCSPREVIFIPAKVMNEGKEYTVAIIGEYAFHRINGLLSVVMPNTIIEIKSCAFAECIQMKSITVPSSVTNICLNAFVGLDSLKHLAVDEGNKVYDSRNGCNAIIESGTNTLLFGCRSTIIPDGVEVIARNAFWILSERGTEPFAIDVPGSVRVIEDCAFQAGKWLSGVTLHEGLDEIGGRAFYGTSIESIVIPASVMKVSPSAFANTKQLKSIKVKKGNRVYDSRKGCNAIIESENDRLVQACATTKIPKGTKVIAKDAFEYVDVTDFHIPSSVVEIEHGAFFGSGLKGRLVIPANVKRIGERAFSCCYGIDELVVEEGVETIDDAAFSNCTSLRRAELPASLKNFGSGLRYSRVFEGCHLLEEIDIPEENPYYYCYRNAVVEKGTLTVVDGTGLGHCQLHIGLQEYRPKRIASGAFRWLPYLTAIWLPETLEEIETGAFFDCPSIEFIYCAGKIPPLLGDRNFDLVHQSNWRIPPKERIVIVVPAGSLEAYRNAPGWKEFKRIIEN